MQVPLIYTKWILSSHTVSCPNQCIECDQLLITLLGGHLTVSFVTLTSAGDVTHN